MIDTHDLKVATYEKDAKTYIFLELKDKSEKSLKAADQFISETKPDTLCVEICDTRYRILTQEHFWKKLKIFDVFKQRKSLLLLANLAAASYRRNKGLSTEWELGTEMVGRIDKAKEIGANYVFVGRDLHVTLQRTWKKIPLKKKAALLWGLLRSLITRRKPENGNQRENPDLKEFRQALLRIVPQVEAPLILESDQYLAASVFQAEGKKVLTVLSGTHIADLEAHFQKGGTHPETEATGKRSFINKALPYVLLVLLVAGFFFGAYVKPDLPLGHLLLAWALPNWIITGIFTMLGKPKLLTLVAAMAVTPFSYFIPPLRTGIVVGLTEAWQRKPVVQDCERLPEDIRTFRGVYRNGFMRVILVAWLAHTGSSIGNYAGLYFLIQTLST